MKTGAKVFSTILLQPWRMRVEQVEGGKKKRKADELEELKLVLEAFIKFYRFPVGSGGNLRPLAELMTVKKEGERGSLPCFNLRVNDTITMPTPAIAMETIFIASTG